MNSYSYKFKVVILKDSPSRSSAMLLGLISAAELNYDGASVSLPPTLRSNYRLFNLVKVQVLSKMYKDNFFSEALQMRNCTTRQLSYRSRFVKYYLTKYKVQRKYYKNIPKYKANIMNITKYSKDMTKYSEVYCWAAPAIGICG